MESKSPSSCGREGKRGTVLDHPESLLSSPPPPSSFHASSTRHFYVAVDRLQFKMETLVDLLGVAGRRPLLPIVLCCSSRDELDAVYSAVSNHTFISLFMLYSDQADTGTKALFHYSCDRCSCLFVILRRVFSCSRKKHKLPKKKVKFISISYHT
ncbi:hypothetical protein HPP92_009176, partial [Vanilla planifolia]